MMKKVILTGPSGAIGHALIQECIRNHIEVYAICHVGSSRTSTLPQHKLLHIIQGDLAYLLNLRDYLPRDCDVFYHLGWAGTFGDARNDMYLQNQNVKYTLDAVELAHDCGCHTFIGAGSQAEYGRVEGKLRAETPAFPETGYGMAKLCAGQMSRIQAHEYEMKHIWTRILSVYGPYDGENTMIMTTIQHLLSGEKPALTKGEQLWDYLYAKDAAAILLSLGPEKSIDGRIYCLGSGKAVPLRDYIEIIRDTIDCRLPLGFGEVQYSKKQVMHLCADVSAIVKDLGYEYRYTFEDGIKETIDWVKEFRG